MLRRSDAPASHFRYLATQQVTQCPVCRSATQRYSPAEKQRSLARDCIFDSIVAPAWLELIMITGVARRLVHSYEVSAVVS
jgi:hypothetical protein